MYGLLVLSRAGVGPPVFRSARVSVGARVTGYRTPARANVPATPVGVAVATGGKVCVPRCSVPPSASPLAVRVTPSESPRYVPAQPAAPSPADGLAALAPNEDNTLPGDGGFGRPSGTDPLTGAPLTAESLSRPVMVCINNDPQARPQFGIGAADVMVE